MVIVKKALFVTVLTTGFFALALIKLEKKKFDWPVVFLPLWSLNTSMLSHGILTFMYHLKSSSPEGHRRRQLTQQIGLIVGTILKFLFEILLCLKLQFFPTLPVYFVMIPFWILLAIMINALVRNLIASAR